MLKIKLGPVKLEVTNPICAVAGHKPSPSGRTCLTCGKRI